MKLSKTKILLLMADKQMTMQKVASAYGVSRERINKIINSASVRPVTAGKLAKALGVNVADILEVNEGESD